MSRGIPEVPLDVTNAGSLHRFLVDVREQLKSIRGPQTAPAPPGKITVSVLSGVITVNLQPTPGANAMIQYLVDISTSTSFDPTKTSTYNALGTPPVLSLGLGTGTFYIRARAQYPNSPASTNIYWGTAGKPTPVT